MNPPFRQLLGPNKRDPAPFATLPMWLYLYFDVLIERRQHAQQLLHGNQLELPLKQLGDVGLLHADELRGFGLSDLPLRHQPLQCTMRAALSWYSSAFERRLAGNFFLVLMIGLRLFRVDSFRVAQALPCEARSSHMRIGGQKSC